MVTESPPSSHNFELIPPIRSERPVWDLNHPDDLTVPHGKHVRELVRLGGPGGAGDDGGDNLSVNGGHGNGATDYRDGNGGGGDGHRGGAGGNGGGT
jgi:hypothetical protein